MRIKRRDIAFVFLFLVVVELAFLWGASSANRELKPVISEQEVLLDRYEAIIVHSISNMEQISTILEGLTVELDAILLPPSSDE